MNIHQQRFEKQKSDNRFQTNFIQTYENQNHAKRSGELMTKSKKVFVINLLYFDVDLIFFQSKSFFIANNNNILMKLLRNNYKYNKITQQQKFHLLTLVLKDKLLIKEAAKRIGINYSTAKTIIFFNRNHCKSYQFDFQSPEKTISVPVKHTAAFIQLPIFSNKAHQSQTSNFHINIVSTIGLKKYLKDHPVSPEVDFAKSSNIYSSHSQHYNNQDKDNFIKHSFQKQILISLTERRQTRAHSAKQQREKNVENKSNLEVQRQLLSVDECSEEYKNE